MTDSTIRTFGHETPVGALCGAVLDGVVVAMGFEDHWPTLLDLLSERYPDLDVAPGPTRAAETVGRYLAGDLDALDELEVDTGGTDFQQRVWTALRTIPRGQTWSYQQLADAVGDHGATRAVGTANGRNPISVVVPCHRVVRADGTLGGYAGGLERKAWLLAHEGARIV